MSSIAQELDQQMRILDPATARRVEQLVRDALALAKTARSGAWPTGYFEQTAGALAGEQFERPDQGSLEQREVWQCLGCSTPMRGFSI